MKAGDKLRDNDPRMNGRILTIIEVLPNGCAAKDSMGRIRLYLANRIHSDGKTRRGGLDLIKDER